MIWIRERERERERKKEREREREKERERERVILENFSRTWLIQTFNICNSSGIAN